MMAVLSLAFAACPMDSADIIKNQHVNQQMYPFLRFTSDGKVSVIAGAPLKEVVIPSSVESSTGEIITVKTFVGYEDRADNAVLETIVLAPGLETISDNALSGAANLNKVDFGTDSKLTTIGEGAFQDSGLVSIEIPNSVTTIGNNALNNNSLKDITLPASLTNSHAAKDVFGDGHTLSNVTITGGGSGTDASMVGGMFSGGTDGNGGSVENVVIGSGITEIGSGAFAGNSTLQNVVMGDDLEKIAENAFQGTANLASLALNEGLKNIGAAVFADTQLDTVVLPSTAETVSLDALTSIPNVKIRYRFYLPESSVLDSRVTESLPSETVTLNGTNYKVVYVESDWKKNGVLSPDSNGAGGPISFPMAQFDSTSTNPRFVLDGYYPVYVDTAAGTYEKSSGAGLYAEMSGDTVAVDANGMITPVSLKDGSDTDYDCTTNPNVGTVGSEQSHSKAFMATWADNAILYQGYDQSGQKTDDDSQAATYKIKGLSPNYPDVTEISITGNRRGKNVTGIEENAFKDNTKLEKVNFVGETSSFVSVGDGAFSGATKLSECTLPATTTSIGKDAFKGASITSDPLANLFPSTGSTEDPVVTIGANAYEGNKFTSVTISSHYKEIADSTFLNCTSLETLNGTESVLSNVAKIGDDAFKNTKLNFDPIKGATSLTSIGTGAFEGCTAIPSVDFTGTQVSKISAGAFSGCTSLATLTVPEAVKQIDSQAFKGNTALTTVTLPNSLTTVVTGNTNDNGDISSNAFDGCAKITAATIPAALTGNSNGATSDRDFVLSDSQNTIKNLTVNGDTNNTTVGSAMQGAANLETVVIGSGVTAIGSTNTSTPGTLAQLDETRPQGSFASCVNLTTVTLPDGLSVIGDGSFQETGKVTTVTVPVSVATIGKNAFANSGLTSDPFAATGGASNLTSIASGAFQGSTELPEITLPIGVTVINDSVFKGCSSLVDPDLTDSKVTSIGGHAYENCTSLGETDATTGKKTLELPKTVTNIGNDAFKNTGLEVIAIQKPDSGTVTIQDGVFADNKDLETITIAEDAITAIPQDAFSGCTSLAEVVIPEGVTSIGSNAFAGDTSLTKVTLPGTIAKITDIEPDAFNGCPVTELVLPAHLTNLTDQADLDHLMKLFPHLTTVTVEKSTDTAPGTTLGNALAQYGDQLTSVTIAEGITEIAANALANTGITELKIPTTVVTVGSGVFSDCTNLKELEIPAKLTHVDNLVDNGGLEKLTITAPSGATGEEATIGPAFKDTDTLKSLTIGENVTAIGKTPRDSGESFDSGSFSGCDSLKEVTLPSTLKDIGDGAFEGCTALDTLKQTDSFGNIDGAKGNQVPDSVKNIGENAFKGTALDRVVLPSGIESVGDGAFAVTATPLKKVTVPAHITSQVSKGDGTGDNVPVNGKYPTTGIDCFLPDTPIEELNIIQGTTTGWGTLPSIIDPATGNPIANANPNTTVLPLGGVVEVTEELKTKYGDNLVCVTDPKVSPAYVVDPTAKINMAGTNPKINVDPEITILGPGSFSQVGAGSEEDKLSVDFGTDSNLTTIGDGAFQHAPLVGDLTNGAPSVGNLELLPDQKLPSNVTGIGNDAFKDSGLGKDEGETGGLGGVLDSTKNEITGGLLPNGLESIGSGAFENTNIGPVINIPSAVDKVGDGAFAGIKPNNPNDKAPGISVQLPADLTGQPSTGSNPKTGIVDMFRPDDSEGKPDTSKPVFIENLVITGGNDAGGTIYPIVGTDESGNANPDPVPEVSISSIQIGDGVTTIGKDAFIGVGTPSDGYGNGTLTITLPSNDITIGEGAFSNVPIITDPSTGKPSSDPAKVGDLFFAPDGLLPDNVTSIGAGAFQGSGYPSSAIGDPFWATKDASGEYTPIIADGTYPTSDIPKITTIGEGAFAENKKITRVTIPAGCASIGAGAFKDCTNLEEIVFEEPVSPNLVIDANAFAGCENLKFISTLGEKDTISGKSVYTKGAQGVLKLPKGVTSVGAGTFNGGAYDTVVLPDSLTTIGTNGGTTVVAAFQPKDTSSKLNVTIPASLTTTAANAVFGADITFGNVTITATGSNPTVGTMFEGEFIDKLVFGDGLTTIADDAFKGSKIVSGAGDDGKTFVLPESLTSIGANAFDSSTNSFAKVNIPASCTSIGADAFKGNTVLGEVEFGVRTGSDITIGADAFKGCSSLDLVHTEGDGKTNGTLVLPESVISVGAGAFNGGNYTSVELPVSLKGDKIGTAIGNEPFTTGNSAGLSSVTVPASLTASGKTDNELFGDNFSTTGFTATVVVDTAGATMGDMFGGESGGDNSLTSVTYQSALGTANTITAIANDAFRGCDKLTNTLTDLIPDTVVYVGSNAFNSSFVSADGVDLSKLTTLGGGAFSGCKNIKGEVTLSDTLTTIPANLFKDTPVTSIKEIPTSVTEIGENAFYGTALTEIAIPNTVTSVGNGSFSSEKLVNITLPASLTSGQTSVQVFGKNEFTSVTIVADKGSSGVGTMFQGVKAGTVEFSTAGSNKITSIGENAFKGNASVTKIVIPSGCTSIGKDAFAGCTSLTEVVFEEPVANNLAIAEGAFNGCSKLSSVHALSDTSGGLSLPAGVLSVGATAFSGGAYTSVKLPTTLTTIGVSAFASGSDITSVTVPASLTESYEGSGLFSTSLATSVTVKIVPDSANSKVGDMFAGSTNIKEVSYSPNGNNKITLIADNAFSGCTGLATPAHTLVPNSVTSIGTDAFNGCSQVKATPDLSNVTTLGASAFAGSSIDGDIDLRKLTAIEKSAFNGTKIQNVTLGDTLTTIGKDAFKNTALTSVVIPDSVTTIKSGAFYTQSLVDSPGYITALPLNTTVEAGAFMDGTKLNLTYSYTNLVKNGGSYVQTPTFITEDVTVDWSVGDATTSVPRPTVARYGYYYTIPATSYKVSGHWMKPEDRSGVAYAATWNPYQVTPVLDVNKGSGSSTPSPVTPVAITFDSAIPAQPVASRVGYTFKGWYNAASNGQQLFTSTGKFATTGGEWIDVGLFSSSATSNVGNPIAKTLYAQWTENTYVYTFNANGGTGGQSANVSKKYDNTTSLAPAIPTRTGYTFMGWSTNRNDASGYSSFKPLNDRFGEKSMINSINEINLYATWEANQYAVTFEATGGSVSPSTMTVTYDSSYGTLPTPTRTGYTFNGWFTAQSGGIQITDTTRVKTALNHSLYAQWKTAVPPIGGGSGTIYPPGGAGSVSVKTIGQFGDSYVCVDVNPEILTEEQYLTNCKTKGAATVVSGLFDWFINTYQDDNKFHVFPSWSGANGSEAYDIYLIPANGAGGNYILQVNSNGTISRFINQTHNTNGIFRCVYVYLMPSN